jgi:acyl dehydratase
MEVTLAGLPRLVGADLGRTAWIEVGQERIDSFAEATEDRQWIHVDRGRASTGPFGTTIAHGYLTLSLASAFLLELLVVTDATSGINYGLDRVRFPAPVPAGAKVRGHVVVADVSPRGSGIQVTSHLTVECDQASRPVATAEVLTLFRAGDA